MPLPSEKLALCAAFAVLLLMATPAADFTMRSLSVFININRDGSVNVEERIEMVIRGTDSRELYEATRATYSDLATWKNRTQLSEMRHHISRASAEISNLRVIPQSVERCNSLLGLCYAFVVLDYSVPAGQNGSGLVAVDKYKPRTAEFSLIPAALSFEQTRSGDIVLPARTNITISVPAAADKIYFSALPENLADESTSFRYDQSANQRYYTGNKRIFIWQGDTLSKFQFSYEIESPLESEVLGFFSDAQKGAISLFLGPEGPPALIILTAAAASLYYFHRINT